MKKFFNFIVNKKYLVLGLFVILLGLSIYGYTFVRKNGDVTSYLKNDTETAIGKEMLEDTFKIMGDATIAIKGASTEELKKFADEMEAFDDVKQVLWIGRFYQIEDLINDPNTEPGVKKELEKSYETLRNRFYNKETDISLVSVYFNKASSSDEVIELVNTMEEKLNNANLEEFAMTGTAVNARDLLDSSIGDIPKFLLIAVAFILIILLLTTKSFVEPLIFLATLGVSILLNMGSNIILGEISSITFSASTILQLALAMDYAVFLMHSYNEELKTALSPSEAMKRALPKTLKAVLASALTTIGGFIALFSMQFGMGYDLGVVLAKGVLLSLITVLTLQPVLTMIFEKLIKKTTHKEIKMSFAFLNKGSDKLKKPLIILALVLLIPSFVMQYFVDISYLTMVAPKDEKTITEEYLEDSSNQLIMMVPYSYQLQMNQGYAFIEELKEREDVAEVFSLGNILSESLYLGAYLTGNPLILELEGNFVAKNPNDNNKKYSLYIINLRGAIESEESYAALNEIKELANSHFGKSYFTGLAQGAYDLSLVTLTDFVLVSILSALIIFIILLLSFKSFSMSAILLLVIELGIWINLSITYLIGAQINFMAYIIISAIQLGATVDYAILLACRYKEELKQGKTHTQAINEAVLKVGPSIVVSAAILIFTCVGVRMVTTNLIVAQITELIARGALLSLVLVLMLLPSIIKVNQVRLDKLEAKRADKARKEELEAKRQLVDGKQLIYRKR